MTESEWEKATAAISLMLAGFPSGSHPGELVIAAFLSEIDDLPLWAIEGAAAAFRRGDVAGHDKRFAPSTAQFREFARTEVRHPYFKALSPPEPSPLERAPEEMAKRRAVLARLLPKALQQLTTEEERKRAPHKPRPEMDPDQSPTALRSRLGLTGRDTEEVA